MKFKKVWDKTTDNYDQLIKIILKYRGVVLLKHSYFRCEISDFYYFNMPIQNILKVNVSECNNFIIVVHGKYNKQYWVSQSRETTLKNSDSTMLKIEKLVKEKAKTITL